MATELRINFDEPRERSHFNTLIRDLRGKKRITIVDDRKRRSDRQNRYYWPCFVQPFGNYLRESKPAFTDEMAHEVFKKMFLEQSVCDDSTGQVFTYVGSTTELNTIQFNEYLDAIADFLATECGFRPADPSVYREPVEEEIPL